MTKTDLQTRPPRPPPLGVAAGPGLYVHVPFCTRKCAYCAFYSLPCGLDAATGRRRETLLEEYLAALEEELRRVPPGFAPKTMYIGGGTPTALPDTMQQRLWRLLIGHLDLSRVKEWTCEVNPGTVTAASATALRTVGINRVSLGIQSFNDKHLQTLGRNHHAYEAEAAYGLLREAGFTNLSLDLMFGIPGATRADVERDAAKITSLAPEHISCYALTVEPDTPLSRDLERGRLDQVPDDAQRAQYDLVRAAFEDAGYEHYELSNFARPGKRCRHNMGYWRGGEYWGCGPSAHSHWRGRRSGNVTELSIYVQRLLNGQDPAAFVEQLPPARKARESLILGLRLRDGVDQEQFRQRTGFRIDRLCGEALETLCRADLLHDDGRRLRLTDRALFVSDTVFRELV